MGKNEGLFFHFFHLEITNVSAVAFSSAWVYALRVSGMDSFRNKDSDISGGASPPAASWWSRQVSGRRAACNRFLLKPFSDFKWKCGKIFLILIMWDAWTGIKAKPEIIFCQDIYSYWKIGHHTAGESPGGHCAHIEVHSSVSNCRKIQLGSQWGSDNAKLDFCSDMRGQ